MEYRTPPLLEAVCDIGFGPGGTWDARTVGLLSSRFPDYPDLQEAQAFEIRLGDDIADVSAAQDPSPRIRLWSHGRDRLIQVGPRVLSVNRLRPYTSWERYRAQIAEALGVYTDVTKAGIVVDLLLTYVNQIAVPASRGGDVLDESELFSFRPEYGSFGAPALGTAISVALADPAPADPAPAQYEVTLRTLPPSDAQVHFQLVVAARSAAPMRAPPDEALLWLDRTHAQIEAYFEAAILPPLRTRFGPISTP